MLRPVVFLFLWLFSTIANAEPAIVRSGEHDGFTRIVVEIPRNTQWRAVRGIDSVTLTIPDFADGFDTDRVYDRIDKKRVRDIKADLDELRILLNCTCNVSAYLAQGPRIVIDVASSDIVLPTRLLVTEPVAREKKMGAPSEDFAVTLNKAQDPTGAYYTETNSKRWREEVASSTQTNPNRDTARVRALTSAQRELVKDLGLAATRGVLEPARARPAYDLFRLQNDRQIGPAPSGPVENTTLQTSVNVKTQPGNLRVVTSRTGSMASEGAQETAELGGVACPPNQYLHIAEWADGGPASIQISAARQKLYGEFDRIDAEGALLLAKTYLYFGFGAEARATLDLVPGYREEHNLLFEITEILEHGHVPSTRVLPDLAGCENDIALWSLLSRRQIPRSMTIETDSVLRALNRLPLHLREVIAPQLSAKLLAYGNSHDAAKALRSLERISEKLPPSAGVAKARIGLVQGANPEARAVLVEAVNENSPQSPRALIALIESQISEGQVPSAEMIELVSAFVQELRQSDIAPDINRVYLMSLISSGQFDLVADILKEQKLQIRSAELPILQNFFLSRLAAQASDIIFLDHVFRFGATESEMLPEADKLALAERLLDLGFAEAAELAFTDLPHEEGSEERALLAARIAIALDRPRQAHAALKEIEGTEATRLRAEAHRLAGEHDVATSLYTEAGELKSAQETAWLADDWRSLTSPDTPVYGTVRNLTMRTDDRPSEPTGMLARSGKALEESAEARKAIENLLSSTRLQSAGAE